VGLDYLVRERGEQKMEKNGKRGQAPELKDGVCLPPPRGPGGRGGVVCKTERGLQKHGRSV
jgi:hypothetical protein